MQLFYLGKKLKKKYGKNAFCEKNHFIISNVTRCIKSFKFFLLGIISTEPTLQITSSYLDNKEQVKSQENQYILFHLTSITSILRERMTRDSEYNLKDKSITLHCSESEIIEHCRSIGLDVESFSMELPRYDDNDYFYPILKFK